MLTVALHVINVGQRGALSHMRGRHGLRVSSKSIVLVEILWLLLVSTCHDANSITLSWLLLFAIVCDGCYINYRVLSFNVLIISIGSWKS